MLDEAAAAAVSGEVRDPEVSAGVCCIFVTASARIRDFDRLAQWSRHVMHVSQAWTNRSMFTYPRIEHAAALVWWGHWAEAEQEFAEALTDMSARPQLAALAMLRFADLRRRQGRYNEARSLLDELEGARTGSATESAARRCEPPSPWTPETSSRRPRRPSATCARCRPTTSWSTSTDSRCWSARGWDWAIVTRRSGRQTR